MTPLPTLLVSPRVSLFHAANAGDYARYGVGIPKTAQPGRKLLRLAHLKHEVRNVVYGLQTVKQKMDARYRESATFGGDSVYRTGAPRPMKMGTTCSQPYDAAFDFALLRAVAGERRKSFDENSGIRLDHDGLGGRLPGRPPKGLN